jgi:ParB family chromosome partitioning protein
VAEKPKGKWAENASGYRPGSAPARGGSPRRPTRPWHVEIGTEATEPSPPGTTAPITWARTLPLAMLEADPDQPRRSIDAAALGDLAASIRAQGVLQPIVVRHKPGAADSYVVVAGERRMRAAGLAGLTEVPCMIMAGDSLRDARLAQLAENLQREDLTPMEEARAVVALGAMDELTQEDLAVRLGKSPTYISRIYAVSRIPAEEYDELATLKLSMSLLYEYAQLPLDATIRRMALELIRDGATVKDVEALRTSGRRATARPGKKSARRGRPPKTRAPLELFSRAVRTLTSLPRAAVAGDQRAALLREQATLARWLADNAGAGEAIERALRALERSINTVEPEKPAKVKRPRARRERTDDRTP